VQDYALTQQLPEKNPMQIRYYGSDTQACGNIHMVNEIMKQESIDSRKLEEVIEWVQQRTSSSTTDDEPIPPLADSHDLASAWETVRRNQLNDIESFLARTLNNVERNVPIDERKDITWYITGGGVLDKTICDLYEKSIKERYPESTIKYTTFSRSRYVLCSKRAFVG
jgi:hypothetical protein